MRNAVTDRIRVTRTGKVLRRAMSQGHFLAKKRSVQLKRKKHMRGMALTKVMRQGMR